MMNKKAFRWTAAVMLAAAAAFVLFAFSHPEYSWPWGNALTYPMYGAYLLVMLGLFVATLRIKRKAKLLILLAAFVLLAAVCVGELSTLMPPEMLYFQF